MDFLGGLAGGFGTYLLGMDQKTRDQVASDNPGNRDVINPGLGWMMGFTFVVSFVGIFSIVLLRKVRSPSKQTEGMASFMFLRRIEI